MSQNTDDAFPGGLNKRWHDGQWVSHKGWRDVQRALASHKTPQNEPWETSYVFWEDSRMYLRRWAIALAAELSKAFSFTKSEPSVGFPLHGMRYTIEEINDRDIHMTVPFIPYENFQKTKAWRDGYTYTEYMEVHRESYRRQSLQFAKRVCTDADGKERKPLWRLPTEADVSLQNCTPFFSFFLPESFIARFYSILSIIRLQ
jgi:hypothetical protein